MGESDLIERGENGTPSKVGQPESGGSKSFLFKAYVIVAMTIVWSTYSILIRYTRTNQDVQNSMYHSTTVVVLSELTKLLIATMLLVRTHQWDTQSAFVEFNDEFVKKPKELLRMSVPSLVYAVQNNLDFVALQNLEPGVYQVTTQLKVLTTVIFMVIMLGRRYSLTRWIAIFFLFCGVALVQLDASQTNKSINESASTAQQNYLVGIIAVLTTCVTAGFAGVYFEKMLKDSHTSLWIRNMQMYFCGVISALMACISSEGNSIREKGFFFGYNSLIWIIIGVLSVGGIFISMVIKYLDNLLKSFASAVSITLVCLLSYHFFGTELGFFFVCGTVIVCASIILYNYVNE